MKRALHSCAFLISLFLLSGCSSQQEDWQAFLDESFNKTEGAVRLLQRQINSGSLRNTQLLNHYADVVRAQKPEMSGIVDALTLDTTTAGPIFQGLKSRLNDAKTALQSAPGKGESAVQEVWSELELIRTAANPDIYAMMLTDPINVLADMSEGQLARVEAMSKEASLQANRSADTGPGSQLVGNPNYGHWRTDSSGSSFWEWYGKYALFSTLFHRPVYYNSWASGRNYSYYHDYGRSHYTSPSQFKSQTNVNNQAKSKFQKTGQSFQSPYAQTKTGAARTVKTPQAKPTSNNFKSRYQSSSSARDAARRTSRSSSGGK